jgi:hypothetical protein
MTRRRRSLLEEQARALGLRLKQVHIPKQPGSACSEGLRLFEHKAGVGLRPARNHNQRCRARNTGVSPVTRPRWPCYAPHETNGNGVLPRGIPQDDSLQ